MLDRSICQKHRLVARQSFEQEIFVCFATESEEEVAPISTCDVILFLPVAVVL